jgi:hypothetical protein
MLNTCCYLCTGHLPVFPPQPNMNYPSVSVSSLFNFARQGGHPYAHIALRSAYGVWKLALLDLFQGTDRRDRARVPSNSTNWQPTGAFSLTLYSFTIPPSPFLSPSLLHTILFRYLCNSQDIIFWNIPYSYACTVHLLRRQQDYETNLRVPGGYWHSKFLLHYKRHKTITYTPITISRLLTILCPCSLFLVLDPLFICLAALVALSRKMLIVRLLGRTCMHHPTPVLIWSITTVAKVRFPLLSIIRMTRVLTRHDIHANHTNFSQ